MMLENIAFALNLVTLIIDILTCLITIVILTIIIHHVCFNRLKEDDKITIWLSTNIYLLLFLFTAILISFRIQTLLGDLYANVFNSPWCLFITYILFVILSLFYLAFVNQAFFRLCRIIYPTYRRLQSFRLYISLPSVELLGVCSVICPLLFRHDITYLSEEYYCYVRYTNSFGILWLAPIVYGIPVSLISLMYIRITRFLRQQPINRAVSVKQRQQRDFLVIQRIVINIGILIIAGIVPIIFIIIALIRGQDYYHSFRIIWPFVSITMLCSSILLIVFTPQLKTIVLKIFQPNRVQPLTSTLRQQTTTV